jgi:hypothetical protein
MFVLYIVQFRRRHSSQAMRRHRVDRTGINGSCARFSFLIMSDVKNTLSTLCKYINSLINVGLTVEHLRLAKYGTADEAVVSTTIF